MPDASDDGATRSFVFNRVWIGGACVVLAAGLIASRPALSLLALLVLVTAGMAAGWNRLALWQLACIQEVSEVRAFPDDVVLLTIRLKNRKPLPLTWLTIETELAAALHPVDHETTLSGTGDRRLLRIIAHVRGFEQVTWTIAVRCSRRGCHGIGPMTLRSGDPFGFFSSRRTVATFTMIVVYPRLLSLHELGVPPFAPLGQARQERQLLTDPSKIIGVREYRPDDPFRLIHWKATARLGALQVRLTEPATAQQLALFLNIDTFEHYWEGLDIAAAEHAIEIAAAIAAWSDAQRYAVGVYANGVVAGSDQPLRVPPGRGTAQLSKVLDGLARISPYSTVPFSRVLSMEAARLPWGSTVVVITPLLQDALIAQIMAMLARGQRVVLVAIGDTQVPTLAGLAVHRVPSPVRPEAWVAQASLAAV